MSIFDCISGAVIDGQMTPEEAELVTPLIARLIRENASRMGADQAEAAAAADAVKILQYQAARKRRLATLSILATDRNATLAQAHPKGTIAGVLSLLYRDVHDWATHANVEARQKSIQGALHAKWNEGLAALKPIAGIIPRTAELRNVARELHGGATGDEAAAGLARSWADAAEYARQRFNLAGGNIGKREDWGMPHQYDARHVRNVSRETFIDDIEAEIDPARSFDPETNMPMGRERIRESIGRSYDAIVSYGWTRRDPGQMQGRGMVANRHQEGRQWTFRDGDAWLRINDKYGNPDLFGTLTGHFERMARDTALLEILGPNPDAMVRHLIGIAQQKAALAGQPAPTGKIVEDAYKVLTGDVNRGGDRWVARSMDGLRNILTSAQLGAAFISSILADFNTMRIASQMNGLPATGAMRHYFRLVTPLGKEYQKTAVRLGLIAENWTSVAIAAARVQGEVMGPRMTRMIADTVMRASFLSPHTQAARWAFGMEFLGRLADDAALPLDELAPPLRNALARYGINAADWDTIRATPLYDYEGAGFIDFEAIAALPGGQRLASRLVEMVQTETDFAIPTPDAGVRGLLTQGTAKGTLIGEIARSVAMYKSFPVTMITTHLMRGLARPGAAQKGRYLADLVISMTMVGGLTYQLKQMQRGKDPVDMDPTGDTGRKFWAAAALQGGGLGLLGDFFFADQNRFGGGITESLAGPVAGAGSDMIRLTLGNLQNAAMGEDTNAGREAVRFLGRYTPGGSLWYTRLAFERQVLDRLQEQVDPRAARSFRDTESRARRDMGQRFWWGPGERTPDRAPDPAAAFGG